MPTGGIFKQRHSSSFRERAPPQYVCLVSYNAILYDVRIHSCCYIMYAVVNGLLPNVVVDGGQALAVGLQHGVEP